MFCCLYFVINLFYAMAETVLIPQIFDEFKYEIRVRKLDSKSSKGLCLRVKADSDQNLKN